MLQPGCAAAVYHRCMEPAKPGTPPLREFCIRSLGPDDKAALLSFFQELSPTTVALRFLGPKKTLSEEELDYFTAVDSTHHVAIAAIVGFGDHEMIVGVARYICLADGDEIADRAEVALTVADEFQGMGIGWILVCRLIRIAKQNGVRHFVLHVSEENKRILGMFRRYLRVVSHTVEAGAVEIVCSLDEAQILLARPEPSQNIESLA